MDSTINTYRLELSFDGTDYRGWQRQANGITVQEVLEEKLCRLFNCDKIRVQGSSRTDSGVHALGMVASFQAPPSPYIPDWKVKKALNRLLPPSIKIREAVIAEPEFNARFSAHSKSYVYVINTGDLNPFTCRWSWHVSDLVNPDAMRESLLAIIGEHDFSSFTVELDPAKDHVRTIYKAEVKTFGPLICIHILGNGFLYKMVRSIIGAAVDIGRNKLPPNALGQILEARSRSAARDTAPALGLFLMKVFYDDSWESYELENPPFQMF
jgi:tRNA pseudouridine38-40 synthase